MKRGMRWKMLCFILCALVFAVIAANLQNEGLQQFDLSVTKAFASLRTPLVTTLMIGMTTLCSPMVLLAICFTLMYLYYKKHYSIPIAVNLMVTVTLNNSLKSVFLRARPPLEYRAVLETGYSFPSGHAMAAGAFYGFLIYLVAQSSMPRTVKKWLNAGLAFIIGLVGLSRVYLGVHYLSDVLAGYAVSIAYLLVYTALIGLYLRAGRTMLVSPMEGKKSKRFVESFIHASEGVMSGFKDERNMIIHFAVMTMVTVFGFLLGLSQGEWLACVILFGLVIGMELMNTAVEITVDICMPRNDPRAKVAKDTSAGAVLLVAVSAAVVGGIIFLPKLLPMIR